MPAAKGNKYAEGNNGGQEPFYSDPDEMQAKIDEYFESEAEHRTSALALHLGFSSRQSLYDYKDKKEFSYIIKKALLKVEDGYETDLRSKSVTGAIFALKNMGWSDSQQVDHTTKGEAMNVISLGKGINPDE